MSMRRKVAAQSSSHEGRINLSFLPELLQHSIRRAQLHLWRDFASEVGQGELRPGQFSTLALIVANPGISQIDLSRELDIDKATIVSLIDLLEREGLAERRQSTDDRRRHCLHATDKGRATLSQMRDAVFKQEAKYRSLFSPDELRQLITMLNRLIENDGQALPQARLTQAR